MSDRLCTYEDCDDCGVGRAAETATHWLCQAHRDALIAARDEFYATGDKDAMKLMVKHTIKAMGGAQAAADSMVPLADAGVDMISALKGLIR